MMFSEYFKKTYIIVKKKKNYKTTKQKTAKCWVPIQRIEIEEQDAVLEMVLPSSVELDASYSCF